MKTVEFVVIFSVCIHFAYTSSIQSAHNEAVDALAKGTAETEDKPLDLSDEKSVADMFGLGKEIPSGDSSCRARNCSEDCRKEGYALGVCISKRCRCWFKKPLADLTEDDEEVVESRAARWCSPINCAQTCRRLGFPRSRCAGGRCICSR